jgi:hypothetical protein
MPADMVIVRAPGVKKVQIVLKIARFSIFFLLFAVETSASLI